MSKKTTPEGAVAIECDLAISKLGWVAWKNMTGKGMILRTGQEPRWLEWGLCPGSSDRIGIRPMEITAEMVGQIIGQFIAVEYKRPSGGVWPEEQQRFKRAVEAHGGKYILARSGQDVTNAL